MAFKFNPFTGNFDVDNDTGAALSGYVVDNFTLNGTDILNKYVILTSAPAVKAKTRLVVIGGIEQEYSADFVVTTNSANRELSWSALGLDGVLVAGDKLVIAYS